MIFVTVGTQLPFDRLVRAVDRWALEHDRRDVFAQVGPTSFKPKRIEAVPFLDPIAFRQRFETAAAIVSHAGMGTIISALELGKPLVMMPRLARLDEHRNDHQLATVKRFEHFRNILVANEEAQVAACLDALDSVTMQGPVATTVSPRLLAVIRGFVGDPTRQVKSLVTESATPALSETH